LPCFCACVAVCSGPPARARPCCAPLLPFFVTVPPSRPPPSRLAGRWYRDPSLPIQRNEITRFPHAVLEVRCARLPPDGCAAPWGRPARRLRRRPPSLPARTCPIAAARCASPCRPPPFSPPPPAPRSTPPGQAVAERGPVGAVVGAGAAGQRLPDRGEPGLGVQRGRPPSIRVARATRTRNAPEPLERPPGRAPAALAPWHLHPTLTTSPPPPFTCSSPGPQVLQVHPRHVHAVPRARAGGALLGGRRVRAPLHAAVGAAG
jgi:hypothetical protein